MGPQDHRSQAHQQRTLEAYNNSNYEIPSFGCVRVTGYHDVQEIGRTVLKIDRPNAYGNQGQLYLNTHKPIAAGKMGHITRDFPAVALYDDSAGTPAAGDIFGPKAESFALHQYIGGYRFIKALETVAGPTKKFALVDEAPMTGIRGTLDGDLEDEGTATMSVTVWKGSSWADDGDNVTVREVLGVSEDIPSGTVVKCYWDWNLDQWAVDARGCA